MQEISNREITVLDIPRHKRNYALWRICNAKHEGTNFIKIPLAKVDTDTIRFLRKRGYKMHLLPIAGEILIEWKYKRSPYRTARTSNM